MGRGLLVSRGMAVQPQGEENEPAVADADRAEQSEAAFGQTSRIETAVGELLFGEGSDNGSKAGVDRDGVFGTSLQSKHPQGPSGRPCDLRHWNSGRGG